MIGVGFGCDWGVLAAIYLALLLFGIGFNTLVAWCERKGYMQGYTALFVVAGVLVTLGAMAVISLSYALIAAGAFAASGIPMVLGSIWRHMRERERQLSQLRREAHGDNPETLADEC